MLTKFSFHIFDLLLQLLKQHKEPDGVLVAAGFHLLCHGFRPALGLFLRLLGLIQFCPVLSFLLSRCRLGGFLSGLGYLLPGFCLRLLFGVSLHLANLRRRGLLCLQHCFTHCSFVLGLQLGTFLGECRSHLLPGFFLRLPPDLVGVNRLRLNLCHGFRLRLEDRKLLRHGVPLFNQLFQLCNGDVCQSFPGQVFPLLRVQFGQQRQLGDACGGVFLNQSGR